MKKKSALLKISIFMFVVLAIAFSANNIVACLTLEKEVAAAKGISIAEAKAGIGSTVGLLCAISGATGVASLVLLAIIIRQLLLKPLMTGAKEIERVSNYDLTDSAMTKDVKKYAKRNDEVGIIARSILVMQGNLYHVVEQISGMAEQVAENSGNLEGETAQVQAVSDEIGRAMNNVSSCISAQAMDTAQGANEMSGLDACIVESLEDTEQLKQCAEKMNVVKDEGLTALRELVENTKLSNRSLIQVKEALRENVSQTEEIAAASQSINNIASQTNLLSLNAAIEAARAGESGRGFAVVAQEIGSLAEETNTLTKQIAVIIQSLVEKMGATMKNMEAMENTFKQQESSVATTEEKFRAIEEGLMEIREKVMVIASSGESMNASKESIVEMINRLSATAQENAASSEEVMASVDLQSESVQKLAVMSKDLSEIADKLKTQAEWFTV